jgi:hypothetical protein
MCGGGLMMMPTRWAAFVQSNELQVDAVVIFIEQGQTPEVPPNDLRTGGAGNLNFVGGAAAPFEIDDATANQVTLLDLATNLRWILSPATEDEQGLAPLDAPGFVQQSWLVRGRAEE